MDPINIIDNHIPPVTVVLTIFIVYLLLLVGINWWKNRKK